MWKVENIQRFQRDINVGVTHVSLVWEEAAENYGRALWEGSQALEHRPLTTHTGTRLASPRTASRMESEITASSLVKIDCDGNVLAKPDYGDFVYFAAIIGTSGQTADVALTTRAISSSSAAWRSSPACR